MRAVPCRRCQACSRPSRRLARIAARILAGLGPAAPQLAAAMSRTRSPTGRHPRRQPLPMAAMDMTNVLPVSCKMFA